jgi:hypothetical protein
MTCLTCSHYDLQSNPRMTALGLGHCKLDLVGTFIGFSRTCERFVAADPEIAAKRIEYEQRLTRDRVACSELK